MDLDKDLSAYDSPDYHFFWGGHCSQWTIAPFEEFGEIFNTAEQFMMAAKAKTFNDDKTYELIMIESDPAKQKKLGRKVENFVLEVWNEVAKDFVTLANYDKFTQNPDYLDFLMEHKGNFFVEASPDDKIWGIGMGVNADGIANPSNWKGKNWLGECINTARDIIILNREDIIVELRKKLDWRE